MDQIIAFTSFLWNWVPNGNAWHSYDLIYFWKRDYEWNIRITTTREYKIYTNQSMRHIHWSGVTIKLSGYVGTNLR